MGPRVTVEYRPPETCNMTSTRPWLMSAYTVWCLMRAEASRFCCVSCRQSSQAQEESGAEAASSSSVGTKQHGQAA
jgi:hypothetical protein